MQLQISQIRKNPATNHGWARLLGFACAITFLVSHAAAQTPSFTGVGHLPGGNPVSSGATRVSGDGTTVIGTSFSNKGQVGFVWTSANGIQFVPFPPGSGNSAQGVNGVTSDGSMLVGGAWGYESFYWTAGSGSVGLPGPQPATADAVSPDGLLIAGYTGSGDNLQLIVWNGGSNSEPGISLLPNMSMGVSTSGHVVASTTQVNNNDIAFTWSAAAGVSYLPGPSVARDISANGDVVVGSVQTAPGIFEAAKWTSSTGWTPLGDLFGPTYGGRADGVSADGSVIVGEEDSPTGQQAFILTQATGMELLDNVLLADGITNVVNWTLTDANDVSADGSTIVGAGVDPAGDPEGWVATVSLPEPSSIALVAFGVVLLSGRRRRPVRLFKCSVAPGLLLTRLSPTAGNSGDDLLHARHVRSSRDRMKM
jgi:uncharacterized membrane protein